MVNRLRSIGLGGVLLLLGVAPSTAESNHPTPGSWEERSDAPGRGAPGAQRTLETGPLHAIAGALDPGSGDESDTFCIRVPSLPDVVLAVEWPRDAELSLRPAGSAPYEYILDITGPAGPYVVSLRGAEGCGSLDIVFAVDEAKMDRYCLGSAGLPGDFHCHGVTGDMVLTSDVALADFDADGDLDAVFATSSTALANRLCPGDSVGRFSFEECVDLGASGASSRGVAVGDLDDDGNEDVVFANGGAQHQACLGDGALGFACQPVEALTTQGRGVALGHLDDDGALDAVFANVSVPSRACFGDGDGGFSSCFEVNPNDPSPSERDVVLGFFDADSNLDAAFVTSFVPLVCLGNGAGAFSCSTVQGVGVQGWAVTAGLVNADSHLDLVFSSSFDMFTCLGDGTGSFSCSEIEPGHDFGIPTGAALVDIGNDGPLDLIVSAKVDDSAICDGVGDGTFTNCRKLNENKYRAEALAIGSLAPASVGHDDFETGDLRAWATSFPDD